MRRPLRSKRAMISPVRLRANASGLTRMRVRSMKFLSEFGYRGGEEGGGSASTIVCSDDVPPRRRRRAEGGGTAPVSASQYGHSFQAGSIGLPHEEQRSLRRRMQGGQRR